ncbi:protein-glutamate O-methyltransferase CheR [bacterium]|nr:protein-glutamate O-methyltransferase CheR [bacterium]
MIRVSNNPVYFIESLIVLSRQFGYHFQVENMKDMVLRIRKTCSRCGYASFDAFLEALNCSKLNMQEKSYLIDELMNGESYFFRHKHQHDWLMTNLLPGLVRSQNRPQARVRVWHAGCSRGEEAYSTALLLEDLRDIQDSAAIEIYGSDINSLSLDQARKGLYRMWSLRSMPPACLKTHFKPLSNNYYELDSRIRNKCQFHYCNLVDQSLPGPFCEPDSFDLIFCRNVLIYFTEQAIEQVMKHFFHALKPGGYLILSPSESVDARINWLERVPVPTGFIYRKKVEADHYELQGMVPELSGLAQTDPNTSMELHYLYRNEAKQEASLWSQPVESEAITRAETDQHSALNSAEIIEQIEQSFRDHNHTRVDQLCGALRVRDPDNIAGYYYPALLCIETGELEKALDWLRKSLYLDNNFLAGLIQLAHVYQLLGKVHYYHRTMRTTQKILTNLDLNAAVPHANGKTAGELLRIIDSGGFTS